MAYLEDRNGNFRIVFRHAGKQFKYKLGKVEPREADDCLARLEENLRLVARGRLVVSPDVDPALFLLSDGRIATRPIEMASLPLDGLRQSFLESHGTNLEANSLATARIHFAHPSRRSARPSTSGNWL